MLASGLAYGLTDCGVGRMNTKSEVAGLRGTGSTEKKVVGEAAHLAGSAILTAGVATALVLVAIPVSIGVGVAGALKLIKKRR